MGWNMGKSDTGSLAGLTVRCGGCDEYVEVGAPCPRCDPELAETRRGTFLLALLAADNTWRQEVTITSVGLPDVLVWRGTVFLREAGCPTFAPIYREARALELPFNVEAHVVHGDPFALLVRHLGGEALRAWLGDVMRGRTGCGAVLFGGQKTGKGLLLRALQNVPELAHVRHVDARGPTPADKRFIDDGGVMLFATNDEVGPDAFGRRLTGFRQTAPLPEAVKRVLLDWNKPVEVFRTWLLAGGARRG